MAGITSNLYPPIVNTYVPAFVINSTGPTTCRIYFSLSNYNSTKDIKKNKGVQVTVCNQKTNASVLDKTLHPSGIVLYDLGVDENRESDNKYYIDISSTDLAYGFQINQYYKVQLRLTDSSAPNAPATGAIDAWLTANTAHFSEWSTICLIRGISQPTLDLLNLDASNNTSMTLTQSTLSLVGTLAFEDAEEEETLKSYQARLYNTNNILLADSGIIYSNTYSNINELNYIFDYMLEDGMSYMLTVDIVTRNLYTTTMEYKFTVIQNALHKLPVDIETSVNEEMGSIKVDTISTIDQKFSGYITFRRASSRTKFTVWEDVHTVAIKDATLDYTWYDYTVESGVWYKYCVQQSDPQSGSRGIVTIVQEPIMVIFDDMFLCADKKQLRLKYNPQITSYKKNIAESKTDTIGSQYPFIKRNGAMNYRQFSVSGTITMHTDYQDTFVSKEEMYGNNEIEQLYNDYNVEANINEYNNYIKEREFREKVIQFLYADNVKLMRTTTEGNMLVRLMDISLTPEIALGRMIYSFSATAYEVDDCTVANIHKYNISGGVMNVYVEPEIETPHKVLIKQINKVGQVDGTFLANVDVVQKTLTDKYSYLIEEGFITTTDHLSKMRLEFKMPPYLVHEDATGELVPLGESEVPDDTTVLGYIAKINNTNIYINPEGIYELGVHLNVYSIIFPIDTVATIDYQAAIYQTEDYTYKTDILYFHNKVGQIWGTFGYKDSVFKRIWRKYYGAYKNYYQKLISINGVHIEAEPGTVCWIQDSATRVLKRFVINNTCSLSLYDDNAVIEGLYFSGFHFDAATENDLKREIVPTNKFVDTGIVVQSLKEITNPVMNGVYTVSSNVENVPIKETTSLEQDITTINNENIELIADQKYHLLIEQKLKNSKRYLFYQGQWYPFTDDNDILCDIDGLVDYWCETMKGVHAS